MVQGKDDNRWRIWEYHEENNLISNLDLRLSTRLTWLCTSSLSRLCNPFRPRHSDCSGNTSWSSSGPWRSSWWCCTPYSGSCGRYRNRRPRSWSTAACMSPTLRRSAGPPPSSGCEIWVTFSPKSFYMITRTSGRSAPLVLVPVPLSVCVNCKSQIEDCDKHWEVWLTLRSVTNI